MNSLDRFLVGAPVPYPEVPEAYAHMWREFDCGVKVSTTSSIEEALEMARQIGGRYDGMRTLVTGSLHLVGGALNLLRP
jgi:folylpolyglutamate synthase